MNQTAYHPWLHRLAVLTAVVALLPIVMGALVTTKDAGMAFRDWPSSDGHGMLAYPWLKSAGDKFLEHGHRLGGVVIGMTSILLSVVAACSERRRWVKVLACLILASVVAQGLLGGSRVLLDQRGLAFVHGSFAALVMGLMVSLAVVTSQAWQTQAGAADPARYRGLWRLALVTCGVVFTQYVLGGLLRHRGMVLYEHLGFAFFAAMMAVWLAMSAAADGSAWLRFPAAGVALLMITQLALGAGAWVARFGFGDAVAVHGSPFQVTARTAHVLCGMLVFATVVTLTVRIGRLHWLSTKRLHVMNPVGPLSATLPLAGGLS